MFSKFGPRIISSQRKISGGFFIIYLGSVSRHFYITFPMGVRVKDGGRGRWKRKERFFVYLGIHNQETVKYLNLVPPAAAPVHL